MDRFFIEELKNKCNEINSSEKNPQMISKVIEAYDCICDFANMGRKEGLLALEEAAENLDLNDDTKRLFFEQITLVVDGTEPELVKNMGANRCVSCNLTSYEGLINLMYVYGSLMIQAGNNLFIVERMLKSMMPKSILEELQKLECQNALPKALREEEDKVEALCKDDKEIDDKDHSVTAETAKALILLSDKDIQRLLRETDISTLALAMKGMPGKARARLFENMSSRLSLLVAEHMSYMGPVRLKDVEEDCVRMMKTMLNLHDRCEIEDYDFSILKVVIDMFDTAEEENRQLRMKYKELRDVISRIYND